MTQLLFAVASLHVFLCPFTKVEESFNIQATHDILYHRHNLSQYDHHEFPGVVPRTFIGPLFITTICSPLVGLLHLFDVNKLWTQYIVRLTLALTVVAAWGRLRDTLQKLYGGTFTWWFTMITVSQYHFMFYMSRPLPNIMVMPLVLLAYEGWLSGKYKQFVVSAGASIIIFRSELAMLFGLFLLIDLQAKKVNIQQLLKLVIPAGACLVLLTVIVDSIFWGRLLWPEAEVFWYNTVLNKSSDWGTSPFLWYFYSALPRGLGPTLLLAPAGLWLDRRLVAPVAPALIYVLLYSLLPHKELRFIIYVFPLLNMAAAGACSYLYIRRNKSPRWELAARAPAVLLLGNALLTLALAAVATTNYPGGHAMLKLHKHLKDEPWVHAHVCNLAAQSGVTRYTQLHAHWRYGKEEAPPPAQLQRYTHLLVEAKSKYSSALKPFSQTHVILDSVDAFSQIQINPKLIPPVKIKTRPAIFILERKDFREYPRGNDIQLIDSYEGYDSDQEMDDDRVPYVYNEVLKDLSPGVEDTTEAEEEIIDEVKEEDVNAQIVDQSSDPDQIDDTKDEFQDDANVEQVDESTYEKESTKKAKKVLEELKAKRQRKKQKERAKIKLETRKAVAASAKEKLKELMKRHKQIADELSGNVLGEGDLDENTPENSGGDIPEPEMVAPIDEVPIVDNDQIVSAGEAYFAEQFDQPDEETHEARTNQNIDVIVEEVIVRLLDRQIYNHKTKPEDITPEDRQVIQAIVEEVLSERVEYARNEFKPESEYENMKVIM